MTISPTDVRPDGSTALARVPARRLSERPGFEDVLDQYDTVALVPQGGGALGPYQDGVFEALTEAGITPRWFSGVSIGAINGAIVAGDREGDRLVDWRLLNDLDHRPSVGAVNVETGNFRDFDSAEERLRPEHIMASGALPPAFAPIRIDYERYWDGGIVSDTPLRYLLEHDSLKDTLVFQVDLFSARGPLPRDMPSVLDRHKDIVYASRTRHNTDTFRRLHNLGRWLHGTLEKVPPEQWTERDRAFMAGMTDIAQVNIVHLVFKKRVYEGHQQDYEFSGTSMREHCQAGLEETRRTLAHRAWLDIPSERIGVSVRDVHRDDPI